MLLGVVGKPNSGKTTFFSAATLVDAEISNRTFTTIKPNKGVSYVRTKCVCQELGVQCNPNNSKCIEGNRYIPIKMVDIAGLVPDAHKGRGLGNQFLSDIMEANALIHVIDLSGGTDADGNVVETGSHDPGEDIKFLEKEISYWILGILHKNWDSLARKAQATKQKLEEVLADQLSGLGITLDDVITALKEEPISFEAKEDDLFSFIEVLRKKAKPIIIAGNKIDVPYSEKNLEKLKDSHLIPCSAESELALRKAADSGLINYSPGDIEFSISSDLDGKRRQALEFINNSVLQKYKSTGVQKIINSAVFNSLEMIVVYPVENENKYTNKKDQVLPDALLVEKGTTARELAGKIHTDFADKFLAAIDARKKQKISADHELKNNDIIKIVLRK